MNWVQALLDDDAIFPNKIGFYMNSLSCFNIVLIQVLGLPFPKNFRDTVKTIVRRLFRVYAHIYSNHFDHICALGIEGSDRWSPRCVEPEY
jgi:MOB kinase activator 1